MSNLNLQKFREWVWPWPWTFNWSSHRNLGAIAFRLYSQLTCLFAEKLQFILVQNYPAIYWSFQIIFFSIFLTKLRLILSDTCW